MRGRAARPQPCSPGLWDGSPQGQGPARLQRDKSVPSASPGAGPGPFKPRHPGVSSLPSAVPVPPHRTFVCGPVQPTPAGGGGESSAGRAGGVQAGVSDWRQGWGLQIALGGCGQGPTDRAEGAASRAMGLQAGPYRQG